MTTAYPLAWPQGFKRSTPRKSRFTTSVNSAVNNVLDELRRFGKDSDKPCSGVLISSNVTLVDTRPSDAGVAVYFQWDGIDCCIPIDIYLRPEDNLQAVAKVIEAERTKLRHGGLNIVRASFRGFAALPPPKDAAGQIAAPWWQVLGFTRKPTITEMEQRYRSLVKEKHPDRGGDAAQFNDIVTAVQQGRAELGRG